MTNFTKLFNKLVDTLSAWLEGFVTLLPNLVVAVLVVVVGIFVSRVLERFVRGLLSRSKANQTIVGLAATLARFAALTVSIFIALGLLKLDKTVTSLLAGVGVVGLALGFAFQDIAANFMSGFIMAIRGPFDVDDYVQVAGHSGRVKHVALRATEIETLDGLSILIPNKDIFQSAIVNYTSTPSRRMDVQVGTAYGDDMSKVRSVVIEAVRDVPHRNLDHEVQLFFESFGDSSINFSVRIWLDRADEASYAHARSEAMIAIKAALDRAGLTIPFPIRTLDFGADAVGGERLDRMHLRIAQADPAGG